MPASDREKLQIAATVSGSIDTFKDNSQDTQGMFHSSNRREQGMEGEKQDLDYDSLSASIALEVCN